MPRILAIANIKGGVGKSTSTANLAAALVERERQVLMVDLDPQASLTLSMGFQPDKLTGTIASLLNGKRVHIEDITIHSCEGLCLVPANMGLSHAAHDMEMTPQRLLAVRDALLVNTPYDYILLDCPAGAGILTGAALAAAHDVIIPFTADYLGFQTLRLFLHIVKEVQGKVNPGLRVAGIFYAMYDSQSRHTREILNIAQESFGSAIPFFSSTIKSSEGIKVASAAGVSILKHSPESAEAHAYRGLAREIDRAFAPAASPDLEPRDPKIGVQEVEPGKKNGRELNQVIWNRADEVLAPVPVDGRRLLLPILITIVSLLVILVSLHGGLR